MLTILFNPAGNPLAPPVADFVGFPLSGDIPLDVQFTDLSTGSPTSWSWVATGQVFGEVYVSSVQNPLITFAEPDTYDVELTVTNPNGSDSLTRFSYVVVGLPAGLERLPDWSAEPGIDQWAAEPGVTAWCAQ